MGQFSPDGESGFPSGGVGRGSISGTIVEQGDSQLIVELDDGSEVAVNLTEETTVSQLTDLESTELAVGDSISVVPSGLQAASASAEVDALEIQRR
jgi:hypothetical protein